MTGLEFLSATLGQLVWPILIVMLILLLKEPIKQVLTSPRTKSIKAGPSGLEVVFRDELEQVERELEASPAPKELEVSSAHEEEVADDFRSEMARLAAVSPAR